MTACIKILILLVTLPILAGCQALMYTGLFIIYGPEELVGSLSGLATIPAREGELRTDTRFTTLTGSILDGEGNDLPGATLLITYNQRAVTARGFDGVPFSRSYPVDARFRLEIPGKITSLAVLREGFYPRSFIVYGYTHRETSLTLRSEAGHAPAKPTRLLELPLTDARITLRRHGTLTQLQRRIESVSVDGKGAGVVAFPTLPATDWNSATWVPEVENSPAGALYVTTARDDQGIVSIVLNHHPGCTCRRVTEVRIGIRGAGNGVLLHRPSSENDAWFEMRRAPDSGYQPEITLDPDTLAQLTDGRPLHLFLKMNGIYARATVREWLTNSRVALTHYGLRLELDLQPDGTPNLEQLFE
jgi:hypothetical protein